METYKAYKFRLLTNEEQLQVIKRTCGCCRVVYNTLLEETKRQLENKENINVLKITELYENYPFLEGIDSLALANARNNFQKALTDFFKSKNGKRKGKRLGFPNFKKKGLSEDSYTTNNIINGKYKSIRIKDNTIKIPKIGFIEFKQHRPVEGLIKSVTITINKDNTVEISILCVINKTNKIKNKNLNELKVIGLDMSMSELYVSSDGEIPNFQRLYRNSAKKRRRLNKSLHRKNLKPSGEYVFSKKWNKEVETKKPSKNREKARLKLAKQERKIVNQRKDFNHKLSRKLVNNFDVIVIEDINLQAMAKSLNLGKSVNDLGFGMFRTFLEYKSVETDSLVVKVPKFFPSSKLCSSCNYKNDELKLIDREWTCPECGVIHNRDENSSTNLKNYFLKKIESIKFDLNNSTVGTTGIQACGDETSGLREILIKVLSLKQEGKTVKFTSDTQPVKV